MSKADGPVLFEPLECRRLLSAAYITLARLGPAQGSVPHYLIVDRRGICTAMLR